MACQNQRFAHVFGMVVAAPARIRGCHRDAFGTGFANPELRHPDMAGTQGSTGERIPLF
jgi:hypothetical protein